MRSKRAVIGDHQLRLLEFSQGFLEEEWCRRPHTGYVLEGRLSVAFPDDEVIREGGDGLDIPQAKATSPAPPPSQRGSSSSSWSRPDPGTAHAFRPVRSALRL